MCGRITRIRTWFALAISIKVRFLVWVAWPSRMSRTSPPEKLHIGYLSVHVDLFIPNPLRCFKCQRYGHGRDSCKNLPQPACFRCGQQGHDSTDCQRAAKRANCQGDHVAASKDWPVWKKEKQIQKVKTENHLGYPEARRLVQGATDRMC